MKDHLSKENLDAWSIVMYEAQKQLQKKHGFEIEIWKIQYALQDVLGDIDLLKLGLTSDKILQLLSQYHFESADSKESGYIQPEKDNEWSVKIPDELAKELINCFVMGPIVDDSGIHYLAEEQFDILNGLKIEVFSNEHPPPHFRVCFQGVCDSFTIKDCQPLHGNSLSRFFRNIKKWHKEHKTKLIEFWNKKRPSDCPVGNYME